MSTTTPISRIHTSLGALLTLGLLAGLAACGPASSDHAPNLEPRAAVGGPDRGPHPLPTVASSPVPLAPRLAPANQGDVRQEQPLGVPTWMAPAPESPDVPVRLRALETWAQQPRIGSVDPLLLALDDPDERVRAAALALLDDDWGRELAAEPPAGQGHEARGER